MCGWFSNCSLYIALVCVRTRSSTHAQYPPYGVRSLMEAWLYLLYAVCSLFLCSAEPNFGAHYGCRAVSVNESLSFQQALDTVQKDSTNSNCTAINLPVGSHVLSSQIRFPAELKGIELIGSWQGHVSVYCSYSVETDYTWYFSELSSLRIQNVHFHDCPRPLRVDTVEELEITNCSFRSVL